MFDYFRFNRPRAVTEQLVERLETLKRSQLTPEELENVSLFQSQNETTQGVYLIYQGEMAVYAGKTDELAQRLSQHLRKLSGRESLDLAEIGYKALLLDENWSTSASENLLINHFKTRGECKWDGTGFGPKDPGKNRDLLIAAGKALGSGWQLMLFKHGFTLYRDNRTYANGVQLLP